MKYLYKMKYLLFFSLALGLVACEDSAQEKLAKIELDERPLVEAIIKSNDCIRAARVKKDIDAERKCNTELGGVPKLYLNDKFW